MIKPPGDGSDEGRTSSAHLFEPSLWHPTMLSAGGCFDVGLRPLGWGDFSRRGERLELMACVRA
ncbi:MAG TPA: hypothetical protein PKI05_13375, partial [Thermogutta sp.]|nr:hypothetical protein [Thermogutta sp.]